MDNWPAMAALALALGACGAPQAPGTGTATIPEAAMGRWGLVPADCTTTRGDEKGLMTVGPTTLEFYESRAVPTTVEARSANRIAGTFAFTGEGMEWNRRMALEVRDGGGTLVRRDIDGDAPGVLTYTACP